jgi:hypothetical protein
MQEISVVWRRFVDASAIVTTDALLQANPGALMHDEKAYPQSRQYHPHLLIAEDDVPLAHFLKRGL